MMSTDSPNVVLSKSKGKGEPKMSKEQVAQAVAGVVLEELEMWPEELQALIGKDHPNKDSFHKGVPYIISAYMEIARRKLEARSRQQLQTKEKEIVKELSEFAAKLHRLRAEHQQQIEQELEKSRVAEAKEIKEATAAIRRKWVEHRVSTRSAPVSKELRDLEKEEFAIKSDFSDTQMQVDEDKQSLLSQINDIDQQAEDWNSKKRKSRRKELRKNKETEAAIK